MKVIHVLNHYLPDHIAGTEVYVSALARELSKKAVEIKIVIPNYGSPESESYLFEEIPVIKYAEPSLPDRELMMGDKVPGGLPNFIKLLQNEQPDIVHFHELGGSNGISLFHVKAAKAAGFVTVFSFHIAKYTCRTGTLMYMNEAPCDGVIRNLRCSRCWLNDMGERGLRSRIISTGFTVTNMLHIDTRRLKNSLGTALALPYIIKKIRSDLHELEHNTNAFIVLAGWYKKILLRNNITPSHMHLILQALPAERRIGEGQESGNEKIRLIFIGRINHYKGVLTLINAVKKLNSDQLSLDIYGKATDDHYMQQCLNAAEGYPGISWRGSVAPEIIVNTMRKYNVLCLPSEVCEMAPLVIQEAFEAGVPVLASDVYGNAEQITDNKNGWLFRFKDADHLAERLQELMNDPQKITQAAAQIKTPEKFSAVADQCLAVYKSILPAAFADHETRSF